MIGILLCACSRDTAPIRRKALDKILDDNINNDFLQEVALIVKDIKNCIENKKFEVDDNIMHFNSDDERTFGTTRILDVLGHVANFIDNFEAESVMCNAYGKFKSLEESWPKHLDVVDSLLKSCRDDNWKRNKNTAGSWFAIVSYVCSNKSSNYSRQKILEKVLNSGISYDFFQEVESVLDNIKNYEDKINPNFYPSKCLNRKMVTIGEPSEKEFIESIDFFRNFHLNEDKKISEKERLEYMLYGAYYEYRVALKSINSENAMKSFLEKCCRDNWDNISKDDAIATMISILAYAHDNETNDNLRQKMLKKILDSNISNDFLQEVAQTMNNINVNIDKKIFTIKDGLLNLKNEDCLPLSKISDPFKKSIEFINNKLNIDKANERQSELSEQDKSLDYVLDIISKVYKETGKSIAEIENPQDRANKIDEILENCKDKTSKDVGAIVSLMSVLVYATSSKREGQEKEIALKKVQEKVAPEFLHDVQDNFFINSINILKEGKNDKRGVYKSGNNKEFFDYIDTSKHRLIMKYDTALRALSASNECITNLIAPISEHRSIGESKDVEYVETRAQQSPRQTSIINSVIVTAKSKVQPLSHLPTSQKHNKLGVGVKIFKPTVKGNGGQFRSLNGE
jgi:hypothetical protein